MTAEFTFKALRKVFTPKRITFILSSYNKINPNNQVDISTVWQRSYHTLSDLLNRTDYNGELIGEHIIKHFNEYARSFGARGFKEADHDNINKQIDDELFNKLNEIKKEEISDDYENHES